MVDVDNSPWGAFLILAVKYNHDKVPLWDFN